MVTLTDCTFALLRRELAPIQSKSSSILLWLS